MKGGVRNLTRALAANHGPDARVNSVSTGFVLTDATQGFQENEEIMDEYEERIPLEQGADPEEIASVMVFRSNDAVRLRPQPRLRDVTAVFARSKSYREVLETVTIGTQQPILRLIHRVSDSDRYCS